VLEEMLLSRLPNTQKKSVNSKKELSNLRKREKPIL
jgi:hypothetical protein